MDDKQFEQTYCSRCGSQRCEGIGTEWFEGCKYRWNHDSYDAAAEIKRLNQKIMELQGELKNKNKSILTTFEESVASHKESLRSESTAALQEFRNSCMCAVDTAKAIDEILKERNWR